MKTDFVVFIPVYNAFEAALDCVKSVIKNTAKNVQIIVLDDASTFGDFKSFISSKINLPDNLILKRALVNGGYVKAVNFGFKYSEYIPKIESYKIDYNNDYNLKANFDIIVLNSDTLVTKNWSEKLNKAAYSNSNIASVTPYSNNAVLASFPRFCRESRPEIYNVEKIAELIEAYSEKKYPELPTAMGFCNYIKRDAINSIGIYDEENFGLGNGEENDFSLRARKLNFKCILDDSTYVYHIGEASFAEQKSELEKKHGKVINKLYPHYMDEISKYCSSDPNRDSRNNLLDNILKNIKEEPRILHIINNSINYSRNYEILGGTELHVLDLVENIKNYIHCALSIHKDYYVLVIFFENLEREFFIPIKDVSLSKIINKDLFDLVHLHHTNNFIMSELEVALKNHGNYFVSLHDFNLSCPRNIFITPDSKFCNQFECSSACGYSDNFISDYRNSGKEILNFAKSIVTFSGSTVELYEKTLDVNLVNIKKHRHGINPLKSKIKKRDINNSLDILILGSLVAHKGRNIIKDLLKTPKLANGKFLNFHVIGDVFPKIEDRKLNVNGKYNKNELSKKLNEINPHLLFLPSLCAETFSYTLEEAFSFGLPALVGPLGAPKERVVKYDLGWVLEDFKISTILDKLNSISDNNENYQAKVDNVLKYIPNSITHEALIIENTYKEFLIGIVKNRKTSVEFVEYLKGVSHIYQHEQSGAYLLLGKLSNYVIYILDSIGVRSKLQNLVFRLLPKRVLYRIKSAR